MENGGAGGRGMGLGGGASGAGRACAFAAQPEVRAEPGGGAGPRAGRCPPSAAQTLPCRRIILASWSLTRAPGRENIVTPVLKPGKSVSFCLVSPPRLCLLVLDEVLRSQGWARSLHPSGVLSREPMLRREQVTV